MSIEQRVIEQFTNYRDIVGRLRVLETYSVGNGITVSRLNEDDHLQELHRMLKGMPSYMYLSAKEQHLESIAHAYLWDYPTGTRKQRQAVSDCESSDIEDQRLLRELENKIRKVIEARTGRKEGYEGILDQLAEYQDLKAEKQRIDAVLEAMDSELSQLLRLRFIQELTVAETSSELGISKRTFDRRRAKAIREFIRLMGMA